MNKGTIITSLIVISLLFGTLYLYPDSFEIVLNEGNHLVKYNKGIFKLYSGRYKALQDEVSVECYYKTALEKSLNRRASYHKVYKARGTKYTNLSYYQEGIYYHIFQDIYFSRGNITREFIVSDYGVKEAFHWVPKDPNDRCRLRIKYSSLEEDEGILIYSKTQGLSGLTTDIGFNLTLDWDKDNEKISMVKRYNNGNLHILTSPFNGAFSYDPEIMINDKLVSIKELCTPVFKPIYQYITHNKTSKPNETSSGINIPDYTEKRYIGQRQIGCSMIGEVNVSEKRHAYVDYFCELQQTEIVCIHNKEGGKYNICKDDCSVTCFRKNLITGTEVECNSLKVKRIEKY